MIRSLVNYWTWLTATKFGTEEGTGAERLNNNWSEYTDPLPD